MEGKFTFEGVESEDGKTHKVELDVDVFRNVLISAAVKDKRVIIFLLDTIKEAVCLAETSEKK